MQTFSRVFRYVPKFAAVMAFYGLTMPVYGQVDYEIGPESYIQAADDWHYLVAFPMIWAPSIQGEIEADSERVDIEVPFENILDNLTFGVIGELYAQKGRWLYSLRVNYLHVRSETRTEGLKGPITGGIIAPEHSIETDMHMAVNDLLVGYEVYPGLRLLTGVRHVFNQVDLYVRPVVDEGLIQVEANIPLSKSHQFDWLVGISYRYWLTDNWGLGISADSKIVGDNDRNYGFNAVGLYRFGHLHNVWFGYRYLQIGNDTEQEGISSTMDFVQQGPMLGWAFSF